MHVPGSWKLRALVQRAEERRRVPRPMPPSLLGPGPARRRRLL